MTRVAIEVVPETNRGLEVCQVIVALDGVCGFEENVTRLIQLYDVSSRSVEPGNINMMDDAWFTVNVIVIIITSNENLMARNHQ